jgi:hypothetical protein
VGAGAGAEEVWSANGSCFFFIQNLPNEYVDDQDGNAFMHYSRVASCQDEVTSNCVFLRAIGFISIAFRTINHHALKNLPIPVRFFSFWWPVPLLR